MKLTNGRKSRSTPLSRKQPNKKGLAGATVLRGVEGYGMRQNHRIHTARILKLAELPLVMIVIDRAEALAQFLPLVKQMVTNGLVIQETVNVVHHAPLSSTS